MKGRRIATCLASDTDIWIGSTLGQTVTGKVSVQGLLGPKQKKTRSAIPVNQCHATKKQATTMLCSACALQITFLLFSYVVASGGGVVSEQRNTALKPKIGSRPSGFLPCLALHLALQKYVAAEKTKGIWPIDRSASCPGDLHGLAFRFSALCR